MDQGWRALAAEAVGTFFLMLFGGAAILGGQPGWLVAVAFGAAVGLMIFALGHVSGAHFNPAITLGFAVTGHLPWRRAAPYMLVQLTGAAAAVLLLRYLGPASLLVAHGSLVGFPATVVEALATFVLAFVIIAVATDERAPRMLAAVAIGAAVFLGALVAGPLTGASMNPARTLAPAALAGDLVDVASHLVGPFVGAVAAMVTYEALRAPKGAGKESAR